MFDFQTMFNSSRAVITSPSVATFEEHEKNDLQAATIYIAIAAAINGLLTAIGFALADTPGGSFFGALIGGIIGTLIIFYIYMGLVYFLGKAFGGTGNFGELAYDIALFTAPLSVASSLLGLIPFIGWIASLAILLYEIYLTYLGIQSGLNLPKDKALIVMGIIFLIILAIGACFFLVIGAFIAAMMSGTSQ